MNNLLLVINPYAGKGRAQKEKPALEKFFSENGYNVYVYETEKKEKTIDYVAQQAGGYDLLVCCGGDGTLNETVTGLMHSEKRPPLGYIPLGTTNDFASSLGIPKVPLSAAQTIVNGKTDTFDIGEFNGKYFTYIAAFGAFTEVSYTTPQEAKNIWGRLAYFFEGISHISVIKDYNLKIEYSDICIEDDFIFGAVTNSMSVAGFKSYNADEMEFNDGLFEGLFIKKPKNLIELQSIIFALTVRDFSSKYILSFRAGEVKVSSQTPLAWTVDGEFGGNPNSVTVNNRHKAVTLFVNK